MGHRNVELEKRNFKKAGEVLVKVWNELLIDKFPVVCKYLENSAMEPVAYEESWVSKHCRISQYFLQVVKCTDEKCCGPFRTDWLRIFPDRFLPAPIQFRQDGGPTVPPVSQVKTTDHYAGLWQRIAISNLVPMHNHQILPYDMYCPSVKSTVKQRVCNLCGIYFPSIAAVKRHKAGKGCEEGKSDDKAKVPIGVTAANKQTPLIMHVDYEIRLPDHDFVKATKHKLTPSVYAACKIRSTSSKTAPEISYSGPTYIAIRSGKHDSSTAYSHGRDFDYALELEEFQSVVKNEGEIKPVAMIFSDGGPDENPCFPKTLDVAVQHFKKHNFDALLISTHAPGLSAYNQVERRMTPLSKALTGLLLPYNTFGNHLDSQRRTIDVELGKHNFKKAGEILVKVWNELLIDKFPVVCEYLENSAMEPVAYEESWVSKHCRISQYFLQVVKCTDEKCCGPFRTDWLRIFPDRFLPAPVQFRQDGGPTVPPVSQVKTTDHYAGLWQRIAISNLVPLHNHQILPYVMYCPSVKSAVKQRVCNLCGIYFPSIAAVKRHKAGKGCEEGESDKEAATDDDNDYVEEVDRSSDSEAEFMEEEDQCPVLNIFELLQNPTFVEDTEQ